MGCVDRTKIWTSSNLLDFVLFFFSFLCSAVCLVFTSFSPTYSYLFAEPCPEDTSKIRVIASTLCESDIISYAHQQWFMLPYWEKSLLLGSAWRQCMKVGEDLSLWEMRRHAAHPSFMKITEIKILTRRECWQKYKLILSG